MSQPFNSRAFDTLVDEPNRSFTQSQPFQQSTPRNSNNLTFPPKNELDTLESADHDAEPPKPYVISTKDQLRHQRAQLLQREPFLNNSSAQMSQNNDSRNRADERFDALADRRRRDAENYERGNVFSTPPRYDSPANPSNLIDKKSGLQREPSFYGVKLYRERPETDASNQRSEKRPQELNESSQIPTKANPEILPENRFPRSTQVNSPINESLYSNPENRKIQPHQSLIPAPKDQRNPTKPADNQYKVINVTFQGRPIENDNSLYKYEPKNTKMEFIMRAVVDGVDWNKLKDSGVTASLDDPHSHSPTNNITNPRDNPNNISAQSNDMSRIPSTQQQKPKDPSEPRDKYFFGEKTDPLLGENSDNDGHGQFIGNDPKNDSRDVPNRKPPTNPPDSSNTIQDPAYVKETNAATNTNDNHSDNDTTTNSNPNKHDRPSTNTVPKNVLDAIANTPFQKSDFTKGPIDAEEDNNSEIHNKRSTLGNDNDDPEIYNENEDNDPYDNPENDVTNNQYQNKFPPLNNDEPSKQNASKQNSGTRNSRQKNDKKKNNNSKTFLCFPKKEKRNKKR